MQPTILTRFPYTPLFRSHFSSAGDVVKAYEHHSRAAAVAQRVYAIEPALAHYTAALEAGAELGLEADREPALRGLLLQRGDRKSTRLNSSHTVISYAVVC